MAFEKLTDDAFDALSPEEREAHLKQQVALDAQNQQPVQLGSSASVTDTYEEEERRRGSASASLDMDNPVHAQLGANIRPDVVSTPSGLQTVTTQKSADYRLEADEEADYVRSRLAEAERAIYAERDGGDLPARDVSTEESQQSSYVSERLAYAEHLEQERDVGREVGPPEQIAQTFVWPDEEAASEITVARANEESAKRQEADLYESVGMGASAESPQRSSYVSERLAYADSLEMGRDDGEDFGREAEGPAVGGGFGLA